MPEISRFFGIIIRMFAEPAAQHHRPHFHAYYQQAAAVFAVDTIELLGGELPQRQRRLVEAWVEIHRRELLDDSQRLQAGRPPFKIEPLHERGVPTMTHAIHRVTSFSIAGPHTLAVSFADGLTRTIDFLPVLRGELYGPLREPDFFKLVTLDPEVHTLVWPNGADFDPATLHDWPDVADDFSALANRWIDVSSSEAS